MAFAIFTREDKFLEFATRPEADAALPAVQIDWPQAFVVPLPPGPPSDLAVDFGAQTVSVDAGKKSAREGRQRQERLIELREEAIQAELRVAIDLETGTTPEALAYRNFRDGV